MSDRCIKTNKSVLNRFHRNFVHWVVVWKWLFSREGQVRPAELIWGGSLGFQQQLGSAQEGLVESMASVAIAGRERRRRLGGSGVRSDGELGRMLAARRLGGV